MHTSAAICTTLLSHQQRTTSSCGKRSTEGPASPSSESRLRTAASHCDRASISVSQRVLARSGGLPVGVSLSLRTTNRRAGRWVRHRCRVSPRKERSAAASAREGMSVAHGSIRRCAVATGAAAGERQGLRDTCRCPRQDGAASERLTAHRRAGIPRKPSGSVHVPVDCRVLTLIEEQP